MRGVGCSGWVLGKVCSVVLGFRVMSYVLCEVVGLGVRVGA